MCVASSSSGSRAEEAQDQAGHEAQWAGDEDAEERSLIGIRRDHHGADESEHEGHAADDEREAQALSPRPHGLRTGPWRTTAHSAASGTTENSSEAIIATLNAQPRSSFDQTTHAHGISAGSSPPAFGSRETPHSGHR